MKVERRIPPRFFVCKRPECGKRKYVRFPSEVRDAYCSQACAGIASRRTVKLFITCKRPGCEEIKEVRRPSQQRKGGYCSQRCNALDHANILNADHRKAGLAAGRARQRRALARLSAFTDQLVALAPGVDRAQVGAIVLALFRRGYVTGLNSKHRQLSKKIAAIRAARKDTAALTVACRMAKQTVYDATSKMGRAGILVNSGGKFSLKL